jgi:F1F0 ATPase subunit 2
MTHIEYALYGAFFAAGIVAGILYFLLLYRTVQLYAAGAAAALVIPLYALRIVGAVALFWFAAQQGAIPLLLALAGFLIVRYGAQRMVRVH